jgi:hypothetical protein
LTLRERNELVAMAFERVLAPALQRLLDDATLPAPDPLHSAHA